MFKFLITLISSWAFLPALAVDPMKVPSECVDAEVAGKLKVELKQKKTDLACQLRPIQKKVVPIGLERTEVWYISDGSCLMATEDIDSAYEKARDFLLTPNRYPQKNGGFKQVLEFLATDHATGRPLEDQGKRDVEDFYTYIGFRGIQASFFQFSYYYYVLNKPVESGDSEFNMPFSTLKNKDGSDYGVPDHLKRNPPPLYWIEKGKKKHASLPQQLDRFKGKWCVKKVVDEDGKDRLFFRYYNRADIGMNFKGTILKVVEQKAKEIHLSTLKSLAEVAQ